MVNRMLIKHYNKHKKRLFKGKLKHLVEFDNKSHIGYSSNYGHSQGEGNGGGAGYGYGINYSDGSGQSTTSRALYFDKSVPKIKKDAVDFAAAGAFI